MTAPASAGPSVGEAAGLSSLLPAGVVAVQTTDLSSGPQALYDSERAWVRGAVASRRQEFGAGRACARAALDGLGIAPVPIGMGAHREPLFPPGVLGTITHTRNYCAAAVCRRGHILGLGIDAECHRPLPGDVAALTLHLSERRQADGLSATGAAFDTILFGLKEALFKAVFPFVRRYVEFTDAVFEVLPHDARCILRPDSPVCRFIPPGVEVRARYGFTGDLVFAGVALLAADQAGSDGSSPVRLL